MPPNAPDKSRATGQGPTPDEVPSERPVITFACEGCVMGHWRGLAVAAWATQATDELIVELEKLVDLMGEKHAKYSTIHLVLNTIPLPTAEGRAKLTALTARHRERLACSAIMLEGAGFWASAVRGVLTSMHVFEGRGLHNKIFGNVEALATWVAPAHSAETGDAIERPQLQQVLGWLLKHPNVREARART